jgi:hypothetical protein
MSTETTQDNYRDEYGFDMTDEQYQTVNMITRTATAMIVDDGSRQSHSGAQARYSEPDQHYVTYEKSDSWVIVRVGARAINTIVRSDGTAF